MRARMLACAVVVALVFPAAADDIVQSRIREEGMARSQIMRTLHFITDLYGPRLTGSPNHKAAADWAVKQLTAWGLANAHLEPWDFGRTGWLNERVSAFITSPVKDTLTVEVLGWTPSTNGTVTGQAYLLELPTRPTKDQLDAFITRAKDRVKGRIVLVGRPQVVAVSLNPPPRRRTDAQVRATYDPLSPAPGGPPFGPPPAPAPQDAPEGPPPVAPNVVADRIDQLLLENGAVVRINDAGRDHGQIRAFASRNYDPAKTVPTVVMRNEDYGRIARILADGTAVELELNIVNRLYPEGKTSYNVIAELPGTDRKDEVVMLGGHFDSWHAATGATDNGIGSAVMMEAIRILQAIGVKPRRTIRLALWSGEEQGLLGSQAYVKEHFGSFESPKPEFAKVAGYFNIDSGTGRARGLTVFGPPAAAAILRGAVAPFEDLGVMGATTTRSRRRGGSDHTSFNEAGLPGIGVGQDPIEYQTYTWHTNLDTYERIIEEDVKRSAIVIAGAVYALAMRDEMLPRFTKDDMPAPPRPAGTTTTSPQ